MNSGMYSAVSANIASTQRIDITTNNLANVNTNGFKKDRMAFESALKKGANKLTPSAGSMTDAPPLIDYTIKTDFSQGIIRQTGNPLDISIEGDGFFVLNTPDGKRYTRQGNFHLDVNGRMLSADGYELQGSGGPITIKGGMVEINSKGEVYADGEQVGVIGVVDFPKPYKLKKAGSTMFAPEDKGVVEQPVAYPRVSQGTIEGSNVQPLEEMVTLIETTRMYEQCVKTIQTFDQMANRAVNDLGKV